MPASRATPVRKGASFGYPLVSAVRFGPPFGGFVAKVFVFAAGVEAGYIWLVIVGILNSIIGVYYYLNVLKYVYLYRMPNEDEDNNPIPLTRPYTIALIVLVVGVILIGTLFAPWFSWSDAAALNLF